MKKSSEFANFDATMRQLIRVPHSKIKAQLEAEKKAKASKKRKEGKHDKSN